MELLEFSSAAVGVRKIKFGRKCSFKKEITLSSNTYDENTHNGGVLIGELVIKTTDPDDCPKSIRDEQMFL